VTQVGVTIDLRLNNGEKQFVYQGQLSNPDIGSLIDPSLLTSDSTASLSLNGTFKTVIAGSNDIIYAASAYSGSNNAQSVSGTAIVLAGSGNTVYGAAGSSVLAYSAGNSVIQNFDSKSTQAINAYLNASPATLSAYLGMNSAA